SSQAGVVPDGGTRGRLRRADGRTGRSRRANRSGMVVGCHAGPRVPGGGQAADAAQLDATRCSVAGRGYRHCRAGEFSGGIAGNRSGLCCCGWFLCRLITGVAAASRGGDDRGDFPGGRGSPCGGAWTDHRGHSPGGAGVRLVGRADPGGPARPERALAHHVLIQRHTHLLGAWSLAAVPRFVCEKGGVPVLSHEQRLRTHMRAGDYDTWRAKVTAVGGRAAPIRLTGARQIQDAHTGTVLDHHGGHIFAPCGNRRESVCPSCSDRYVADAFHLVRAGLVGGEKGVTARVTEHPRAFVTLTAPSFGPVHTRRETARGRVVPCHCGQPHREGDTRLSTPVDPDSYDYTGAVLWQAHSGPLWQRFTMRLRRELAKAAGIRVREFADHARLSYGKVAEYQQRGLVHFHAVIRLDGPTGPDDPPPKWAGNELLQAAIHAAAAAVTITTQRPDGTPLVLRWGSQVDVRPIRQTSAD